MSCLLSASVRRAMSLRSIPRAMLSSGSVASPTFFNREKEITHIIDCLQSKPAINVFMGPPNCGKSALLRHVLDKLGSDRPIVSIDMRTHPFYNASSFLATLETELAPWYKKMQDFTIKGGVSVGVEFAKLYLEAVYQQTDGTPVDKLKALFAFFEQNLPIHSFWTGSKYPILFIDEANKMVNLTDTETDRKALHAFLSFLVMCTKQVGRFDVVLASSDSFYHMWLTKYIGSSQFNTYVIGNLTKDDAKKYWEEHALKEHRHKSVIHAPSFEDAYYACGGNIHLLNKYAAEYYRKKGKLVPEDFSLVIQQGARLVKALLTESAEWNEADLLKVMEKLIESENGFLLYDELCKELGEVKIVSLIEANLLHLRPTPELSYDLENAPKKMIVTADSPTSALAMKLILEEYSKTN